MKKLSSKYLNYKTRKYLKDEVPRWIVMVIDLYITLNTFLLTFLLLKYLHIGPQTDLNEVILYQLPIVFLCSLVAFLATSSYKGVIRHTGLKDVINLFFTNLLYLILISLFYWVILRSSPDSQFIIGKSVILVHFLMNLTAMVFLRILYKGIYEYYVLGNRASKKIMIYGAGESGVITHQVINKEDKGKTTVFGFIDDNPKLRKKKIEGLKIYSPQKITNEFIRKNNISDIVISIQNISSSRLDEILNQFSDSQVELKMVPAVSKWLNGGLNPKQIKSLNIDDFLGREPIKLDSKEVQAEMNGKRILVTGAAGSIGSEISRQLMAYKPSQLILLDQAESALYDLQMNSQEKCKEGNCVFLIGDVRNQEKMEKIFIKFRPDIVFHAAAYKHVPLMEDNPAEAVVTNVRGTKIISDLALKYKAAKFVMISTDKAVNPTSIMGATKRVAERYVTYLNSFGTTKFIVSRFGNVLGSNGSVIPIFKKQIENGGPLTVTSPEITRFFMTIPEACQLVLEAASFGSGGEVFVFDMGEPVKILDLAKKIIRLSGLKYPEDINIVFTGLRPGEKLYEELLTKEEVSIKTHHPKIMIAEVEKTDERLKENIENLIFLNGTNGNIETDKETIILKIKKIVPEYHADESISVEQ